MRLHWNVYGNGGGGIANQIMSIQVGMMLSFISGRDLILYLDHPLAFSDRGLFVHDLFDIDADIVSGSIDRMQMFPSDFGVCYYSSEKPNDNFALGRDCVNILDYNSIDIGGDSSNTLGFYSFKNLFDGNKPDYVHNLMKNLRVKEKYWILARNIYNDLGCKYSIHVRRGDFCKLDFFAENFTTSLDKFENTIYNNFYHYPILVHTNEEDEKYFKCENQILFIDKIIKERHPELDSVEIGLISMLIAMMSERFVGSLGSTFTGLIHQYRKINNPSETFKYLFSESSVLNRFGEEIKVNGQYTWNQLKLRHWSECNWQREYPECYDTHTSISNAHELNLGIS